MSRFAKILGLLSLVGTIVPPILFLTQNLGEGAMKLVMLLSTVVWFVTAPLWMKGGD